MCVVYVRPCLGSLRPGAPTRWPRRRPAQVHVVRAQQRAVAAVCERRDDQAAAVAEVLVAVGALRVEHAHNHGVLLPVVAQTRLPAEVVHGGHLSVSGSAEGQWRGARAGGRLAAWHGVRKKLETTRGLRWLHGQARDASQTPSARSALC